ncbi:MAG: hypothetical protein CML13_12220 [Puniceicoccaceae bacterium]|nr:hypothetical protein [Puniceicoccaceae bacterium]
MVRSLKPLTVFKSGCRSSLRASAAVKMAVGRLLRSFGKGRKDRQIPVGKMAAQFLQEYVKQVRPTLL